MAVKEGYQRKGPHGPQSALTRGRALRVTQRYKPKDLKPQAQDSQL